MNNNQLETALYKAIDYSFENCVPEIRTSMFLRYYFQIKKNPLRDFFLKERCNENEVKNLLIDLAKEDVLSQELNIVKEKRPSIQLKAILENTFSKFEEITVEGIFETLVDARPKVLVELLKKLGINYKNLIKFKEEITSEEYLLEENSSSKLKIFFREVK